jgi:protein-L-isoaspartate(D-aspartate) O-methyltransferase
MKRKMKNFDIETHLREKGITSDVLLNAFKDLPEEFYLSEIIQPYFYEDVRIEKSLDKLEPRVVFIARMLEQMGIKKGEKILIAGVDSIFVLVILSKIYKEVYSIETNETYAKWSQDVLKNIGVSNIEIEIGKPELGLSKKAPFDAILIASGLEEIPDNLKKQLKVGGNMLIPIGLDWSHAILELTERLSSTEFKNENIRESYFIPRSKQIPLISKIEFLDQEITDEIGMNAKPFTSPLDYPIDQLLKRIGNAKVVLIGEASHGTSEFYRTRQEITKALIEKCGFNFVCAEADWSDAEQINKYVKNDYKQQDWMPFVRFPQWMWKNAEVLEFVEWLKKHNNSNGNSIGFYGLDLYGMENSIDLVIKYLEEKDPNLAMTARERYGCITPYLTDPAIYGKLVLNNHLQSCEQEVVKMLFDLLKNKNKLDHSPEFFYTYQNATVVADAERYYKSMYYGSSESWNLRDLHMFYTLRSLMAFHGPNAKTIVWAHNSHVGNALATEIYARGEINIGHLCKEQYGNSCYSIGFGTHHGTVAAAENWGSKMEVMKVNESLQGSFENLCHHTKIDNFTLPLREQDTEDTLRTLLSSPKLERAIGVIYRPKTELLSHYFQAVLSSQFDEYIWINKTKAVTPITITNPVPDLKNIHPFSLIDE